MALRFHLGLFKFNPFGVVVFVMLLPQVSPRAIISRSELLRFKFNPFGVVVFVMLLPQVFLRLFKFNPFGVGA
jgi:hypothetical protein